MDTAEYRLVAKKGEGTFSEVLKAQCIKNGKYVAIKCMKNHFDSLDQVCPRLLDAPQPSQWAVAALPESVVSAGASPKSARHVRASVVDTTRELTYCAR